MGVIRGIPLLLHRFTPVIPNSCIFPPPSPPYSCIVLTPISHLFFLSFYLPPSPIPPTLASFYLPLPPYAFIVLHPIAPLLLICSTSPNYPYTARSANSVFCLPHHPVIKKGKLEKNRGYFNADSKWTDFSLNGCAVSSVQYFWFIVCEKNRGYFNASSK